MAPQMMVLLCFSFIASLRPFLEHILQMDKVLCCDKEGGAGAYSRYMLQ